MSASLEVADSPKMLRETLCQAQSAVAGLTRIGVLSDEVALNHVELLQRLIDACDVHRPLGSDGKHGDLHTATCGCEDRA